MESTLRKLAHAMCRDFLSCKVAEAVLTSTHNLCFGAKIRKIGIPLHTPVFLMQLEMFGSPC